MCRIWSHAGISRRRKLDIYMSCVVSKLLYSLESVWLVQHERLRLDAFHHSCLRKMLGIQHSYLSRVPNSEVLSAAALPLLSQLLTDRQISLYKKIAGSSCESFAKALVCTDIGTPRTWYHKRRRGRPRQMWAESVYFLSLHACVFSHVPAR